VKIYIYNLLELNEIMNFFNSPPPEMDLYNFFYNKLKTNYTIVDSLDDADIAFIPVDFTRLIYGRVKDNKWHEIYTLLDENNESNPTPKSQPQTYGIGQKENFINFFWSKYIKDLINKDSGIPHFMLFSYVLFEISFKPIDESIFILSYEDEVSFFDTLNTFDIGTGNRMIPIPYIQNENLNLSFPKTTSHQKINKEINLSFIGTIFDENRPSLNKSRGFLNFLNNKISFYGFDNILDGLSKTKYLFVLRGDTPSRICFCQCFAYNIVPIIFESEVKLYSKILCHGVSIIDSCLVLPDKKEINDYNYSILVDDILTEELSNEQNYYNRIKNHKSIFHQINYFSEECIPVKNVLNKLKYMC
jgi:hypothetical protein